MKNLRLPLVLLLLTSWSLFPATSFGFSLPSGNPLDRIINDLLNQTRSLTNQVQQQLNQVLQPMQQDIARAIQEAIGPNALDVEKAQQNVQQVVAGGGIKSADGVNPMVRYRDESIGALTQTIEANLSQEAQEWHQSTLEATQRTLAQVNECNEQGKNAPATQEALKALLCQQNGIAAMNATMIPIMQRSLLTTAALSPQMAALNHHLSAEEIATIRRRQGEAMEAYGIFARSHYIGSPQPQSRSGASP